MIHKYFGAGMLQPLILACVALAVCPGAHGQGRGPTVGELKSEGKLDPPPTPDQKLADLDAWLRRLVGRFRKVNPMDPARTDGPMMDCVGIGEGPGVHCVSGAGKLDRRVDAPPTMGLYGIDPDTQQVRYMRVNGISVAETNLGKLRGDSARFFGTCPVPPTASGPASQPIRCEVELRIEMPSADQDIQIVERRSVTYRGRRIFTIPFESRSRFRRIAEDSGP
jgi:hypothetical protein